MKKILYFLLLAVELFIGTLLMISLWDSNLYIPVLITAVATIALVTWQIISIIKTTDIAAKKKIMLRIALFMLIPMAVFVVTYIFVAVSLIIAFATNGI